MIEPTEELYLKIPMAFSSQIILFMPAPLLGIISVIGADRGLTAAGPLRWADGPRLLILCLRLIR